MTARAFDRGRLKERVQQAAQRTTFGFVVERKFKERAMVKRLAEYGFIEGNHKKVIVTWGWTPEAKQEADVAGIELWNFRDMILEIASGIQNEKGYFTDDTLRTINLLVRTERA